MAARKDFASKKRTGKTASRGSKKPAPQPRKPAAKARKPFPLRLLLVTVMVVGALAYLLYSLLQVNPGSRPSPPAINKTQQAPAKAAPAPKPAKPQAPAKPQTQSAPAPKAATTSDEDRFEFYKMLPKSQVTTSDPTVYKSTPKDAVNAQQYLLQTGSFRSAEDADRMRAQLILLGLPNVRSEKSVTAKGDVWYRVRTGPFRNRTELKKARNKLAAKEIFPLEIKAN